MSAQAAASRQGKFSWRQHDAHHERPRGRAGATPARWRLVALVGLAVLLPFLLVLRHPAMHDVAALRKSIQSASWGHTLGLHCPAQPPGAAPPGSRGEAGSSSVPQRRPRPKPAIPGSRLAQGAEVLEFRGRWDCITVHHGTWVLNRVPRLLPVRGEEQEVPKNQVCRRQVNNSDIAKINALVLRGDLSSETWPVPESLMYEWRIRPDDACGEASATPPGLLSYSPDGTMREFDGHILCQALAMLEEQRGQPAEVFVVGDSLSAAFMSSLEAQLRLFLGPKGVVHLPPMGQCENFTKNVKDLNPQYANYDEQYYDHGHYVWHGTHCAALRVCQGTAVQSRQGRALGESKGFLVHFGRTMHLSWISEAEDLFMADPLEKLPYPWADDLIQRSASVALLNTGHFVQPHSMFLRRLNFTVRLLRKKLPHLLIIYRSTASAHLQCMRFKGPLEIPQTKCGAPYHWGEFAVQNKLARRIVEDVGGVWLDVYSMTELRPDWHLHEGDCLHYCAPGPIDTWVKLFANMLLELA